MFNDKPWLSADNDPTSPHYGRLYLTWTRFTPENGLAGGPIYLSTSDDAGKTWTVGRPISGSSPLCTFQNSGPAGVCDEDQFSTPVVLPDGTVAVHFANYQHQAAWETPDEVESTIMVVRSSDGGATWSAPVRVADLEDGGLPNGTPGADYPLNAGFGEATQTGHQFRTMSVEGMTADPVTGNLHIAWTDNRDGVHDTADPVTHTNVFMATSTDKGLTWSAPIRVTSGPADKWMAWPAAYNGKVSIGYMDGTADYPTRDKYGFTIATSTNGGASWSYQSASTALSDPDHSLWFRPDPARYLAARSVRRSSVTTTAWRWTPKAGCTPPGPTTGGSTRSPRSARPAP